MNLFLLCLMPLGISASFFTVVGYNAERSLRPLRFADNQHGPEVRNKLKKLDLNNEDKVAVKIALDIIDHDHKATEEIEKVEEFAENSEAEMKKLAETVKLCDVLVEKSHPRLLNNSRTLKCADTIRVIGCRMKIKLLMKANGDVEGATKLANEIIESQPPEDEIKPKLSSLIENLKDQELSPKELEISGFIVAIGSTKLESIIDEVVPTQGTEAEQKAQEIKEALVEQETDKLKLKLNLGPGNYIEKLKNSELSSLLPSVLKSKEKAVQYSHKYGIIRNPKTTDSQSPSFIILKSENYLYGKSCLHSKLEKILSNNKQDSSEEKRKLIGQQREEKKRILIGEQRERNSQQKSLCLFTPEKQYCVKQIKS